MRFSFMLLRCLLVEIGRPSTSLQYYHLEKFNARSRMPGKLPKPILPWIRKKAKRPTTMMVPKDKEMVGNSSCKSMALSLTTFTILTPSYPRRTATMPYVWQYPLVAQKEKLASPQSHSFSVRWAKSESVHHPHESSPLHKTEYLEYSPSQGS